MKYALLIYALSITLIGSITILAIILQPPDLEIIDSTCDDVTPVPKQLEK